LLFIQDNYPVDYYKDSVISNVLQGNLNLMTRQFERIPVKAIDEIKLFGN